MELSYDSGGKEVVYSHMEEETPCLHKEKS